MCLHYEKGKVGSRANAVRSCAVAWLQGDLPPASGLEPPLAFFSSLVSKVERMIIDVKSPVCRAQ